MFRYEWVGVVVGWFMIRVRKNTVNRAWSGDKGDLCARGLICVDARVVPRWERGAFHAMHTIRTHASYARSSPYRRPVHLRPSFSTVPSWTNVLFFLSFSVGRRALAPMYEPVPPVRRAPRCCHLFASLLLTFCTSYWSSSWAFPNGAQPPFIYLAI